MSKPNALTVQKTTTEIVIEEMLSRKKAEKSFHEFVKQAWHLVEGDTVPFIDGWHIQAICEHLEAVKNREIRFLLINLPPRCSKSTLISVLFPAWGWIDRPSEQFLYSSYAHKLSIRDSVRCRRVIESEWYQKRWGDNFFLLDDQNSKVKFDNDKSGYRMCVSISSSVTGEGGSILTCFPEDTLILTNLGEIAIGKIVDKEIDCQVLSYNHSTNETEYKPIEAYEKNPGKQLLEIDLGNGHIIECTEDHPVYVEGRGYVAASTLKPGEVLLSYV